MSNYIKVSEYAQRQGVTERTVYRWVKNNDIEVKRIKGVLHVKVDVESTDKDQFISTLMSENCHLREQVQHLQHLLEKTQERSDTIIMQLTKQLEHQQFMLEDMRNRSLWTRIKTALGFALP